MFVNEIVVDEVSGRREWRTIDRERGLELKEIRISYDQAFFALKVEGREVLISAAYRHAGENKSVIQYTVAGMGGLLPDVPAYKFSSYDEKTRIARYLEEALQVYGLHYSLSKGRSVEVKFADQLLSSSGGAQ